MTIVCGKDMYKYKDPKNGVSGKTGVGWDHVPKGLLWRVSITIQSQYTGYMD